MRRGMSSLEVARAVRELQPLLERRLARVHALEGGRFTLKFTGEERPLFIDPKGALFFSAGPPGERAEKDRFLKLIRARLENRRLERMAQSGFDRILRFGFGGPSLVVELFSGGNLILLEADDRIADAARRIRLRSRAVLPGVVYAPPAGADPRDWTSDEFASRLRASKSDVVRTLAAPMGLGPDVAQEACARAGVDPGAWARNITDEDALALRQAAMETIREGVEGTEAFVVGAECDEVRAFRPAGEEVIAVGSSFLEALAQVYAKAEAEEAEDVDTPASESDRIRESQMKAAGVFRARAAELQIAAGALLGDYARFEQILAAARGSKGKSLPEGATAAEKPKRFKMEVAGAEVELEWALDTRANANSMYSEAKTLNAKAVGALRAAEERAFRAKREKKKAAARVPSAGGGPGPAHKARWFEKFRYSFTSDGLLIIGGRSAQDNERLVKRHLGEKDVFVHADVHGAASILLRDGADATEDSLRQACAMAVCYSKLWPAGVGAGDAFWVTAEQVSKSPPSGEFVARGAFFISGRKNFLKGLPLELAIGPVEWERDEYLVAGSPAALGQEGTRVVIAPGDREAADVAKEIARRLGSNVESVQRLMPPGKSRLVER